MEYHDDAGCNQDVAFDDFDGLGHFRDSTTTGNFTVAGESRGVATSYNPGSGTLELDSEVNRPPATTS